MDMLLSKSLIRLTTGVPAAPALHPRTAASVAQGIPQDFVMKNTTKFADPMLAFSDQGGQLGRSAGLSARRESDGRHGPAPLQPRPGGVTVAARRPSCSCGGQGVAEV
jgi:hypothetical protein